MKYRNNKVRRFARFIQIPLASLPLILAAATSSAAVFTTGDTSPIIDNGDGNFFTDTPEFNYLSVGQSSGGTLAVTGGSRLFSPTQNYPAAAAIFGGLNTASSSILVTGDGSALYINGTGVAGDSGSSSVLVNSGGSLFAVGFIIGGGIDGHTGGGLVNVDGSVASFQVTTTLSVGNFGNGVLNLSNGATLSTDFGSIGSFGGSNGSVHILSGSNWSTNILTVGYGSTGSLEIASGAIVETNDGNIGSTLGGFNGTGTVTVDGPTTQFIMDDDLDLGYAGTGTLILTNQASVTVDNNTFLGDTASGSVEIRSASTFFAHDFLLGSGSGGNGSLLLTNAGSKLIVNGNLQIGFASSGTITISDHANMTVTGTAYIGLSGTGVVNLSTGASVTSGPLTIGANPGSQGTMTLDGPGTSWSVTGGTFFGAAGSANVTLTHQANLTISNGFTFVGDTATSAVSLSSGAAINSNGVSVGNNATGNGTINIDGVGTSWTATGTFFVGAAGVGTLALTDHATLTIVNDSLVIGNNPGGNGTATVDNASILLNGHGLYAGASSPGSLTISHGGRVMTADFVTVGTFTGNPGPNIITVQDQGSTFAGNNFYIGDGFSSGVSATGSMVISGGANVTATTSFDIGQQTLAMGAVSITSDPGGPLSSLTTGDLVVGNFGSGNLSLTGGKITGTRLYIGNFFTSGTPSYSASGVMTVDGASSTVNFNGVAHIGDQGSGILNILNGAHITFGDTTIASDGLPNGFRSSGKISLYSTEGAPVSTLTVNGFLVVGNGGAGELDINAGAQVTSTGGSLGTPGEGIGTGVLKISDPQSKWTINGDLYVDKPTAPIATSVFSILAGGSLETQTAAFSNGFGGTSLVSGIGSTFIVHNLLSIDNGTLTIANGATATSSTLRIGSGNGNAGSLTVTGTDPNASPSTFNAGDATVGDNTFGQLTVQNGANFFANSLTVGAVPDLSSGEGGKISLSNISSVIQVNGQVTLGESGTGSLTIGNTATLTGGNTTLGHQAGSTGNANMSSGTWNVNGTLIVADAGNAALRIGGTATRLDSTTAVIANQPGSIGTLSIGFGFGSAPQGGAEWDVSNLTVGRSGNGTLSLDANTVNAGDAIIGDAATGVGKFNVLSGTVHASSLDFGKQAGAYGAANFGDDTGSTPANIEVANSVIVADSGNANVTVSYGARLSANSLTVGNAAGSVGYLYVDGRQSDFYTQQTKLDLDSTFTAGATGNAQAFFNNASLLIAKDMLIGTGSTTGVHSQNTVVFDNADGQIANSVVMGGFATNNLYVQNSATLTVPLMTLGKGGGQGNNNNIVNITNPNSKLNITDSLIVGASNGGGFLQVSNGATASSFFTQIGTPTAAFNTDGTGQITVDAATFNAGILRVSTVNNGAILLANHQAHVTASSVLLGNGITGYAQITLDSAAELQCTAGVVNIGKSGNGTLKLFNFGELFANETNLYDNGSIFCQDGIIAAHVNNLGGQLTLSHDPTFAFNSLVQPALTGTSAGGIFSFASPPYSPATLTIVGDYTQTAGILSLEIGGDDPALVDQFLVNGNLTLDGTLNLSFANNYLPHTGDSFSLFPGSDTLIVSPDLAFTYDGLAPGFVFSVDDIDGQVIFTAHSDGQALNTPEPTSLALLGMAIPLLLKRRRRAD